MTEDQFADLCAACDRVLLAPDSSIERMAIGWLHVLNEHPSNLAQYSNLFAGLPADPRLALKSALIQLRQWLRGRQSAVAADLPAGSADVLFVSHLLNPSQVGAAEDFYFGTAPEALAGRGATSCVLLKNHTRLAAAGLGAQWPTGLARRIVLSDTLGLRRELSLRRALTAEAHRIRIGVGYGLTALERKICDEAGRQARSMASLSTLRFYYQMLDWVTALQPKAVVVTFEGHAWERLAFAAARAARPDAICIGYHHTILFPRQHAALRPLGKPFDPDVLLTAGIVSARRFRAAYAPQSTAVAAMGIHRRQNKPDGPPAAARRSCLVIPDGILSEIVVLFDFALEAARHAPEIPFVLRLHPVLSRQALVRLHPRFGALPPNVSFSSQGIEEDFKSARCALYRGSNASIYAVIAGLRPFYVRRNGELPIDALHPLQTWKKIVSSPGEFVTMMHQDCALDEPARGLEAAAAVAFCESYFMPVNFNTLFDALSPALPPRATPQSNA